MEASRLQLPLPEPSSAEHSRFQCITIVQNKDIFQVQAHAFQVNHSFYCSGAWRTIFIRHYFLFLPKQVLPWNDPFFLTLGALLLCVNNEVLLLIPVYFSDLVQGFQNLGGQLFFVFKNIPQPFKQQEKHKGYL